MSEHVIHATDADFDATVLQSAQPVLVDFWAPWCGPCRAIAPLIDRLGETYAGRAKVVKVDVQQYPVLGARYNVRSIPMLMVFKDGQVHGTQMGAPPDVQAVLARMIDQAL